MSEAVEKTGLLKRVGGAGALLSSGPVGFGLDFVSNVAAGDNIGTSAMKASVTGVLAATSPQLFYASILAPVVRDAGLGYYNMTREKQTYWNNQFAYSNVVGGNYMDTQRAQTMRQAAVQSIQGSKLNARSALGSEARILNPYSTRRY